MAATDTPYVDRIIWNHVGFPAEGGTSPLGEYVVAADEQSITFWPANGGKPEGVPISPTGWERPSATAIYWACVNHNKRLLGILL